MLTLYDYLPSGNGYKVRLLLSQLRIPFRLVQKDILAGETLGPGSHALSVVFQLGDGSGLSGGVTWQVQANQEP